MQKQFRDVTLGIEAICNDGQRLYPEGAVVPVLAVLETSTVDREAMLSLQICLPREGAEQLFLGLESGSPELYVENVPSLMEVGN